MWLLEIKTNWFKCSIFYIYVISQFSIVIGDRMTQLPKSEILLCERDSFLTFNKTCSFMHQFFLDFSELMTVWNIFKTCFQSIMKRTYFIANYSKIIIMKCVSKLTFQELLELLKCKCICIKKLSFYSIVFHCLWVARYKNHSVRLQTVTW